MYGTPQRTATEDANAGIVNPSTTKEKARENTHAGERTAFRIPDAEKTGANALAQSLTRISEKILREQAQHARERAVLEGSIRQGNDYAINEIDKENKRSGWTRAIFGPSASYRGAQQRAVQNATGDVYLEEANKLQEYAGETPEEYAARLKDRLEEMLEPFDGDKETQQLVTQQWAVSAAKLAAKHRQEHYAYTQEQNRATYEASILKTFDAINTDRQLAHTAQEKAAVDNQAKLFFKGVTRPPEMDKFAWRSSVINVLGQSLRQNNIGMYTAAKKAGFLKSLTPKERVVLDQAISAYDTDYANQVNEVYASAAEAAANAASVEEAKAAYATMVERLAALEQRSTDSPRARLALAGGRKNAAVQLAAIREELAGSATSARTQQMDLVLSEAKAAMEMRPGDAEDIFVAAMNSLDELAENGSMQQRVKRAKAKAALATKRREILRRGERIAEQAAEAEHKAKEHTATREALRMAADDPTTVGALTKLDRTPKELRAANDDNIIDAVKKATGEDSLDMVTATKKILEDPMAAIAAAKEFAITDVGSSLVEDAVDQIVTGFDAMMDPSTHGPSQSLILAVSNLGRFARNEEKFQRVLGDRYAAWEMMRQGVKAGVNLTQLRKEINEFYKNKGTPIPAQAIPEQFRKNGKGRWDYMQEYLSRVTGQPPAPSTVTRALERWKEGMVIYRNNTKAAEDYVAREVLGDAVTYRGHTIHGARSATMGLGFGLKELLDGAQRPDVNLMTSILGTLAGNPNREITRLDQLHDWNMEVYEGPYGVDGFVLTSASGKEPVRITRNALAHIAAVLKQRNEFVTGTEVKENKAKLNTWMNESVQFQTARPLFDGM